MPTVSELRVTLKALDRKLRVSTMNKPTLIAKIAEYQAKAPVKTTISSTTAPKTAPQTDKTKSPSINDTASVKNMKTALEVLESKRAKCDKNIVRISKLKKKIKKAGKEPVVSSVAQSKASAGGGLSPPEPKKSELVRISIMNNGYDMDKKTNDVYTSNSKYMGRYQNEKKQVIYDEKIGGKLEPIQIQNNNFFLNKESNSVYTKHQGNILFIGNYSSILKKMKK